jgi:integrase
MTATNTAIAAPAPTVLSGPATEWAAIRAVRPSLSAACARYLTQIGVTLRPASVDATESSLRAFCVYLVGHHPTVVSMADVGRDEIEGYKCFLAARFTAKGTLLSVNHRRQRLGMVRTFFDRIIEWDWPDAPTRCPIFVSDLPRPDEPLPKFLDDADATRLARSIAAEPDPLRRLALELLRHTGMRVGELCALEADAVVQIGDGWWLRIPVGKLHNDRYVPLLPQVVALLDAWRVTHDDAGTGLLLTNHGRPLNRAVVTRMLNRAARRAGLGHLHPHQLRHTLATQAINRGMRLEAIAALLGHRTLRMTIRYARIANRTVADEYHAVSAKVEALYADTPVLDAGAEGPTMRRVRADHHRMLANGWCTRPAELDCSYETICESCGFFKFIPTLKRQADHAAAHDQPARAALYARLAAAAEESAS